MPGNPDWPAYPTGPRDSIFALGVISIKFAELESILIALFGNTFDFGRDEATVIAAKVGGKAVLELTAQQLAKTRWSDEAKDLMAHFITAFGICFENRNHLMHSTLAWSQHTILYKTSKQGNTIASIPKTSDLRRIADDMETYQHFGRKLCNAISNLSIDSIPVFPVSLFPLPDKPPLPYRLNYTTGPQVLLSDHQ